MSASVKQAGSDGKIGVMIMDLEVRTGIAPQAGVQKTYVRFGDWTGG